ncbi:MAG TPA: hypothetical protein VFU71_11695 [Burkholderiaceae bacterium]|nr:hypothetical protein [Burkholderiaceae bacterium]
MSESLIRTRLENVMALARLLERVEAGAVRVDADQYRQLVTQLQTVLAQEMPADALDAILRAHSAAAEVYENMHYQHAGLSRAPLERSAGSEVIARQILARIAARRASNT